MSILTPITIEILDYVVSFRNIKVTPIVITLFLCFTWLIRVTILKTPYKTLTLSVHTNITKIVGNK